MNNEIKLKLIIDGKDAVAALDLTDDSIKELYHSFREAQKEVDGFTKVVSDRWNNVRNTIQGIKEAWSVLSGTFKPLLDATIEVEKSQRKLLATSKLTGQSFDELKTTSQQIASALNISASEANEFTISLSKLGQKAGDTSQTADAVARLLDLAAAQGLSASEGLQAVQQAILGIDEGTDKLFQKNPSVIYDAYAKSIGTTAGKLSDQQKAQALLNEIMTQGIKVQGEYLKAQDSTAGSVEKFERSLKQTQSEAGKLMAQGLAPVVDYLSRVMKVINDLSPAFAGVLGALAALTTGFITLRMTGIIPAISSLELFGVKLMSLKGLLLASGIGIAIAAIGMGIDQLTKAAEKYQNTLKGLQESTNSRKKWAEETFAGMDKKQIQEEIEQREKNIHLNNLEIETINRRIEAVRNNIALTASASGIAGKAGVSDISLQDALKNLQTEKSMLEIQNKNMIIDLDAIKNNKPKALDQSSASSVAASGNSVTITDDELEEYDINLRLTGTEREIALIELRLKRELKRLETAGRLTEERGRLLKVQAENDKMVVAAQERLRQESIATAIKPPDVIMPEDIYLEDVTIKQKAEITALKSSFDGLLTSLNQGFNELWENVFGKANSLLEQFIQNFISSMQQQAMQNSLASIFSSIKGDKDSSFKLSSLLAFIPGVGGIASLLGGLLGFAEGGIVTRPVMGLVGEAGPEAIIPLKQLNNYISPNVIVNLQGEMSVDMRKLNFNLKKINRMLDGIS